MQELIHWILNGHTPERCTDLERWSIWYASADRHVALDTLAGGAIQVSTIFIGISIGSPLLFETMIFKNGERDYQRRYSTWDEAEAGHKKIVEQLQIPTILNSTT